MDAFARRATTRWHSNRDHRGGCFPVCCAGELGPGSSKPHGRDLAHGDPEGADRIGIGGAMDGALSLPMRIVDRGVERLDRGVEKTLK